MESAVKVPVIGSEVRLDADKVRDIDNGMEEGTRKLLESTVFERLFMAHIFRVGPESGGFVIVSAKGHNLSIPLDCIKQSH